MLIAGGGERVTLRQVAQHADASNFGEHAWAGGVRSDEALQRRWVPSSTIARRWVGPPSRSSAPIRRCRW